MSMKLRPSRTRSRARHTDWCRVLASTSKAVPRNYDLRDKYRRLRVLITTKMEALEEPTKVIRRMSKVAKGLPKVGRTVEDDQKHVFFPKET